jgi:hypothetical protein
LAYAALDRLSLCKVFCIDATPVHAGYHQRS